MFSREHFRLRRDPETGKFFLKDLSRLGTTINGVAAPSSIEVAAPRNATATWKRPCRSRRVSSGRRLLSGIPKRRAWLRNRSAATVPTRPLVAAPISRAIGAATRGHPRGSGHGDRCGNFMTGSNTMLKCAGASDLGRVRHNNEDAWYMDAERGIFLVVDGIGGEAAGEKAAAIAVDRIRARLERQTGSVEQRVREAITVANNEILRAARGNPQWQGMACVLTLVAMDDGSAVVGHVGDSRSTRSAVVRSARSLTTFAGGGARRRGRTVRARCHAPSAPQRSLSRRGQRGAFARRRGFHRHRTCAVRVRRGAAAVHRRSQRPGDRRIHPRGGGNATRAIPPPPRAN